MNYKSKIYVAGHNGLVGSAIVRELKRKGIKNILTATRGELDLTNQVKVLKFLKKKKPTFIIIAAAKVGGIHSNNTYKAEFIYENLMIQSNIIHSAFLCKIKIYLHHQTRLHRHPPSHQNLPLYHHHRYHHYPRYN